MVVDSLFSSPFLDRLRDWRYMAIQLLLCWVLHLGFIQNNIFVLFLCTFLSKKCNHPVVLTLLQLGRIAYLYTRCNVDRLEDSTSRLLGPKWFSASTINWSRFFGDHMSDFSSLIWIISFRLKFLKIHLNDRQH